MVFNVLIFVVVTFSHFNASFFFGKLDIIFMTSGIIPDKRTIFGNKHGLLIPEFPANLQ
jgi:hypothetical protein